MISVNQIGKVLVVGCLLLLTTAMKAQEIKSRPYQTQWATDLEEWQVVDHKYQTKTWKWNAAETLTITDSKRANDDWLISPAIDFSGKGTKKVMLSAAWNKAQSSNIALYYSLNYDGDQEGAEWVLVEEKIIPDGHPYGFKSAAYFLFSQKLKVTAPKVHFAIRYMPHNEVGESQNEIRIRRFKVIGKK